MANPKGVRETPRPISFYFYAVFGKNLANNRLARNKASDANIGIITILVHFEKNSNVLKLEEVCYKFSIFRLFPRFGDSSLAL